MGQRDIYFKGQQENEELICFFRHHWISQLKNFAYLIILAILAVLFLSYFKEIQEFLRGNKEMKAFFLTGFLGYTFFLHRTFIKLINHFVNIGIITDLRIIDHQKSIFFVDIIDSIDMAQIQNIEQVERGFFHNIFRYGDLKIYLNASAAVKIFAGLPNVKFHFRCISRQKEARQMALVPHENIHQAINEKPAPAASVENSGPSFDEDAEYLRHKDIIHDA